MMFSPMFLLDFCPKEILYQTFSLLQCGAQLLDCYQQNQKSFSNCENLYKAPERVPQK